MALEANLNNCTVHGLRHTCAVLLLKNGATLDDVSRYLRHVSIGVTSRYYLHFTDEQKEKIADVGQSFANNIRDINKKKNAPVHQEMSKAN
jgi:Site-specific recombinase XerD